MYFTSISHQNRRCRDRMVVGFTITYENQCVSQLTLWVWITLRRGMLDTTMCDEECQSLAAGWLFSPRISVSSTNKTDRYDITEILLKVALNTITLTINCWPSTLVSDLQPWYLTFNPGIWPSTLVSSRNHFGLWCMYQIHKCYMYWEIHCDWILFHANVYPLPIVLNFRI